MIKTRNSKFEIRNCQHGFTLIELLVVISLLGALAAITLTIINPLGQFQRARDAQRKADVRQIQSALEMYRSDNGKYPASLTTCGATLGNDPTCNITYLSKIPVDPKGGTYTYTPAAAPAYTYSITVCLENVTDPQKTGGVCAVGGGNGVQYSVQNP